MQSRRVRKNKRRAPSNEVFWGAPSPPLQHLNPSRMRALSRTGNHFYSPSCQKKNTPPPPPERMGAWGGTHALEVRVLERSSGVGDRDGAATERGTTLLRSCCCCCFCCCCFSTAADAEVAPLRAAGDELDGAAASTTSEGLLVPREQRRETALRHLSSNLRSKTRLALLSCCCCDPDPDVDATIGARKTSAAEDIAIKKKERGSAK